MRRALGMMFILSAHKEEVVEEGCVKLGGQVRDTVLQVLNGVGMEIVALGYASETNPLVRLGI